MKEADALNACHLIHDRKKIREVLESLEPGLELATFSSVTLDTGKVKVDNYNQTYYHRVTKSCKVPTSIVLGVLRNYLVNIESQLSSLNISLDS